MRLNLLDDNVHRELKKLGFVEQMTKTEDRKDCYYQLEDVIVDGWGNCMGKITKQNQHIRFALLDLVVKYIA